jgi:hypothetical protein
MQETQQQKILSAFQLVLRPIVKILLRYGIGYAQFAETVKTAFVDVSSTEFGIRGRPTNISRIAVMTGLTRKEIRRIRTKIEGGSISLKIKSTPITEILHRWHSEEEFLDEKGRPAVLPFLGEKGSFSALVKKFGGDVPPGAMRTELIRVGSVDERNKDNLVLIKRSFWSSDKVDHILTSLVHSAYPLICSIEHNLGLDAPGEGVAQYSIHSLRIRRSELPKLKRICNDRLRDIASSFDDLFMAYETVHSEPNDQRREKPVVVGLYYFDEQDGSASYTW